MRRIVASSPRRSRRLLCSEGWARWVRARARNGLCRYSLNNQLLIALQQPEASYVCGFKAWLELGYCVRKGERERPRVFFRAVPVFDTLSRDRSRRAQGFVGSGSALPGSVGGAVCRGGRLGCPFESRGRALEPVRGFESLLSAINRRDLTTDNSCTCSGYC